MGLRSKKKRKCGNIKFGSYSGQQLLRAAMIHMYMYILKITPYSYSEVQHQLAASIALQVL